MKKNDVRLADVIDVYTGPEVKLWELLMGEQIHIGGRASTLRLGEKVNLNESMHGVDLCCCLGAGMRVLTDEFGVKMTGVDATPHVIEEAKKRSNINPSHNHHEYVVADVTDMPLPTDKYDFVWGEDAWCYVEDKKKLVQEAFRVLKKGGRIAFTDWLEGPKGLKEEDAARICGFMKFPYMENLESYTEALKDAGFINIHAEDLSHTFAPACELYLKMLTEQLTTDALNIIGGNKTMFDAIITEMKNMKQKAEEGCMGRGLFIAEKA